MAINFPDSPSNGDTATLGGTVYTYNTSKTQWTPAAAASDAGGTTVVANLTALLATTGMSTGDIAFVTGTNKAYMYTGANWFVLAEITDGSPTTITGVDGTILLQADGTATVITAASTDPDGFPLTWSYTSSGLGSVATISQADNVFTITPSTVAANAGSFTLTISVTDGTSTPTTTASAISLVFAASGTLTHTVTITDIAGSAGNDIGNQTDISPDGTKVVIGSDADKAWIINADTKAVLYTKTGGSKFGARVAISNLYTVISDMTQSAVNTGSGLHAYRQGEVYVYNNSTGALVYTINSQSPFATPIGETTPSAGNGVYFGNKVKITDHFIMILESRWRDVGGGTPDRVHIYKTSDGSHVVTHNLKDSDFGTGSQEIADIGIHSTSETDGHYIIGAHENDFKGNNAGAAWIFDVATNTKQHDLYSPDFSLQGNFGSAVAIHGNNCVVAAEREEGLNGSGTVVNDVGRAHVFNVSTGALISSFVVDDQYATAHDFGEAQNALTTDAGSIGINGTHYVIGAYDAHTAASPSSDSGSFWYIKLSDSSLEFKKDNPTGTDSQFGYSVGLSDNQRIVSGAASDDTEGTNAGRVYIYD